MTEGYKMTESAEFLETLSKQRLKFLHEKFKKNFAKWNKSLLDCFPDVDKHWQFIWIEK